MLFAPPFTRSKFAMYSDLGKMYQKLKGEERKELDEL